MVGLDRSKYRAAIERLGVSCFPIPVYGISNANGNEQCAGESTKLNRGRPQDVVEVANDKQEWEVCDIISKEDVDGVPHYLVQWSATLVPKYEMGKARALVARYKVRL